METTNKNQENIQEPVVPAAEIKEENHDPESKRNLIIGIVIAVVVVGLIIFATISLFRADLTTTSRIRDIFIIFMALESLVLGAALIILITQLAVLINILKNEIKPILDNTNETVNNLKGTTAFLSNNLVEPVMKLNEYLAGLRRFVDLVKPVSKTKKSKNNSEEYEKENTNV